MSVGKREDREGYLFPPSKDGTVLRDEGGVVMGVVRAHIYQTVAFDPEPMRDKTRISLRSSI